MRDGWVETTLGNVLTRRSDRLGKAPEPRILTVTEGAGLVDQLAHWGRRVATEDVSDYKVVDPGDVVYNVYLLWKGAIGQSPFLERAVTSPVYEVFTPKGEVESRYLGLLLRSPLLLSAFDSISIGSIQRRRRAPWQDFERISILLPPLREQRRIVDLIGTLDEVAKEGMEAAARLDLLWWRLADDLRVGVSGLPVKLLGEIADIGGGLTKNKKDAEHPDALEVPYLRVANVLRRRLDLRDIAMITAPRHRIEAARLLPGDVLMNEGGDKDKLGRGAVWRGAVKDCAHQNHVFRVRVRDDRFSPEFLSAWANSFGQKWFETNGTQTTGIASINKSTLGRFPVPDIDLSEQQRWAELLQGVTDQEDEYRAQARRLQRLRSSLLDVLLSGEHEIPESYDELMGVAS